MLDNNFQKKIKEMKGMANMLTPHTFPKVSFNQEKEVLPLKQRKAMVDGYDVVLCYSKADYSDYFLESIQVQSCYAPFLPFFLVCKIGRAFLGQDNLSYIEFFRNGKKVYCWTIKSRNGRSLLPGSRSKPGSYEGFTYNILESGSIDLF